jgi:putative copper resistance protein D
VATQSGVARFEDDRLWVHMVQHTLLGLVVPLLVVLAAPLTLVLQTGGPATRRGCGGRCAAGPRTSSPTPWWRGACSVAA